MVENDKYELERKIEKLEFQIENLTKQTDKDKKMLDWQADFNCRLEEKIQIALEALELCVKTYQMCELREVKEAIKKIKGDDND